MLGTAWAPPHQPNLHQGKDQRWEHRTSTAGMAENPSGDRAPCAGPHWAVLGHTAQRSPTGQSHLLHLISKFQSIQVNINFSWFGWAHIWLTYNQPLYMEISVSAVLLQSSCISLWIHIKFCSNTTFFCSKALRESSASCSIKAWKYEVKAWDISSVSKLWILPEFMRLLYYLMPRCIKTQSFVSKFMLSASGLSLKSFERNSPVSLTAMICWREVRMLTWVKGRGNLGSASNWQQWESPSRKE